MEEQVIIAVSREFGSAGHEIAEQIAKDRGMTFYDRGMLDEIASEMNVKVEVLEQYDEKPRNFMMTRKIGKYSNSMEEIITEMQFDYIKKKAEEGESFVIVGRCSETVLQEFDGMISIFVCGDEEHKLERVMKRYDLGKSDALSKMKRHDFKRKKYHNRHSDHRWGDSRFYDICINSSQLCVDATVRVLENYIEERLAHRRGNQ